MRKLFKPLLPLLYAFLRSEAGKKLLLDLLRSAAKQTTNTLDDEAVNFLQSRLYPKSNTNLQWFQNVGVSIVKNFVDSNEELKKGKINEG